jgi:hypothetical protein
MKLGERKKNVPEFSPSSDVVFEDMALFKYG